MYEEPEKTPEQLLADKKAAFEANPDQFIPLSEIVVAVKRTPNGIAHYIGEAKRSELQYAKAEIQFQIDEVLRIMALEKRANALRGKKIILPGKNKGAFGRNN